MLDLVSIPENVALKDVCREDGITHALMGILMDDQLLATEEGIELGEVTLGALATLVRGCLSNQVLVAQGVAIVLQALRHSLNAGSDAIELVEEALRVLVAITESKSAVEFASELVASDGALSVYRGRLAYVSLEAIWISMQASPLSRCHELAVEVLGNLASSSLSDVACPAIGAALCTAEGAVAISALSRNWLQRPAGASKGKTQERICTYAGTMTVRLLGRLTQPAARRDTRRLLSTANILNPLLEVVAAVRTFEAFHAVRARAYMPYACAMCTMCHVHVRIMCTRAGSSSRSAWFTLHGCI